MYFFSPFKNKKIPSYFLLTAVLVFLFHVPIYFASAALVEVVQAGGAAADTRSYMSADGRYLSYTSANANLVLGDTNGVADVFLFDRELDTYDRVSLASDGTQSNGVSSNAVVSDDGRYVAFESQATNLVPGDTNGVADVFVYDRQTDTIERVNVDDVGNEADAAAFGAVISGDGQKVGFVSAATNLIFGEVANGNQHAYVYNIGNNTIKRIDEDENGVEGDASVLHMSLSEDGRYAAFDSFSSNLLAGYGSAFNVYIKDTNTEEVEIVSVTDAGVEGNSTSRIPYISRDGRYVSFESFATNLVPADTNGDSDIFIYDRQTDTIEMTSVSSGEVQGNLGSQFSSVSSDGNYVVFFSNATNLINGDTNGVNDVFLRDRVAGITTLLQEGTRYGFIAADGEFAFYNNDVSGTNVYSINRVPTDITLAPLSIDENTEENTPVGNFTATDGNTADTHTFSLTCTSPGADDGSFSVDGDLLIVEDTFDFETKSSYSICVRVTDSESATYDEVLTITINDLNESSGGGGPTGDTGDDGDEDDPPPEEEPDPIDPPPPPPIDPIDPPPEEEPPVEPTPEEEPDPVDEPTPTPEDPSDNPSDDLSENNDPSLERDFPVFEDIKESVAGIATETVEFIEKIPEEIKDTAVVAGLAVPAIVAIVTQPAVVVNVLSVPARLWNLIPIWLGFRRRKRPWGTVYDSVTKQPLDPVYIELRDKSGKSIATTITDIDGRFGFLVPPGKYNLSLKKDGYSFPSAKLADKPSDELYGNIYRGEEVEITGADNLLINNIPMDSVNFNWNEFEKSNNRKLMKFYSKRDVFLAKIAEISFWGGLLFSLVFLFVGSGTLNYIILGIYTLVFLLRLLGVRPKKPGYIIEKETGFPLSFGLVKVFSASLRHEVAHAVISKTGKYYVLVPKGEYYLSIEKKTGEDSYEEIYISNVFKTSKGFIGKKFSV